MNILLNVEAITNEVDLQRAWEAYKRSTLPSWRWDVDEEKAFWEVQAETYDERYNLARESPQLFKKLSQLCLGAKSLLEIGCGTGNFLLPLANLVDQAEGIDLSPHMLEQLCGKAREQGITNIDTRQVDMESLEEAVQRDYDCVYSVNSLYRVKALIPLLQHIYKHTKRLVLVRTVQSSPLATIYDRLQWKYAHNEDYRYLGRACQLLGPSYHVSFQHQKGQLYDAAALDALLQDEYKVMGAQCGCSYETFAHTLMAHMERRGFGFYVNKIFTVHMYVVMK